MHRLHNSWKPMLLGALLMLVLVGVAGAVPTDQPNALGPRRQIMISAADFYPSRDTYAYVDYGWNLSMISGSGYFRAPVDFPYPLWVTIDKFELFACDNDSAAQIRAYLRLNSPAQFQNTLIGEVETGTAYASPTNGTWQDTTMTFNVKNPADDVYVDLDMGDSVALKLYGVRVFYYVGK